MYQTFPHFKKLIQKTVLTTLAACSLFQSTAKEGMWMPPNLKKREADMNPMGLQIPVERLYNTDGTGLNNAVVLFGRGCTGEVISPKGLLLTNHHCGYGTVQGLSSAEKDYFAHGFWAMNPGQEIPCPGLTVSFIRKMENVSDRILYGLPDTLDQEQRQKVIDKRIKDLEKGYRYADSSLEVSIKPYYYGNQYWAILSETFRDIRLVGFPPNGIGAFGGDTDNWMWPRHTGDFSIFRIYAGKGNKPAAYSPDNKPYETKQFFPINAKGIKEGDFTMVYGFPGTTQEYISSSQLDIIQRIQDPIRIAMRTERLNVWNRHMTAKRDVFLKYTSKKAGIANGWKKWQGEVRGLELNNVLSKKRDYETSFMQWASASTDMGWTSGLLPTIQANASAAENAIRADEYIREAVLGIELIAQGSALDALLQQMRAGKSAATEPEAFTRMTNGWDAFYRNYDAQTDKEVFTTLMPVYFREASGWVPPFYTRMYQEHGKDFNQWAQDIYQHSLAVSGSGLKDFAQNASPADSNRIKSDPAWQLYRSIIELRSQQIQPVLSNYYKRMEVLNRQYMAAQMRKDAGRAFYPDANLTLRLTYGTVKGIDPDGPAPYSYQTNLDEVIAKDNQDVAEFAIPQKLKDLHAAKQYGRWAVNGTVPVCFIADNHTSGGNSGSPVLNARGELIGTNFDRIWEGTMSDLYFDPRLCRNISVDIRYTLFVIEQFGGAGWLLKEMKIIR